MLGKSYTVKQSDTLWDLSASYLDDPMRWPEIFYHNNKPEVVAATGLRIVDPDLIFVNQHIYIPEERVTAQTIPGKTGKVGAKAKFRSVPFKYEFDAIPVIVVVSSTHVTVVSLVGSVTTQSEKTYDILAIQNSGFVSGVKAEADSVFGKLVADAKVGWNESQKKATFEIGLTFHSKNSFPPDISVSAGISTVIPGLPVMKVSMKTPAINQPSGKIAGHFYAASDFGVEMEIFPKQGDSVRSFVGETVTASNAVSVNTSERFAGELAMPRPSSSQTELAMPKPAAAKSGWWTELSPDVLKTVAYLIIVATIAEDIATLGAGVADDAASFAVAAAMLRLATSRPVVNTVVRTGARIMVQGGRTAAAATTGVGEISASSAYAK